LSAKDFADASLSESASTTAGGGKPRSAFSGQPEKTLIRTAFPMNALALKER
jgi:hypothetical protein